MKNIKSETMILRCIILFGLVVLLSITGCASLSSAGQDDIIEIVSLINESNSTELTELSADSFLLDTEILHGSSLIGEFWNGLSETKFTLNNPVVIETRAPQSSDTNLFGNTDEINIFFARYLPKHSRLFRIGADNSEIVIILGPTIKGQNNIIAFGGPF